MSCCVITVADTVLGYGSSQILGITKGIAEWVGGDHLIFQPFVPHRKLVDLSAQGYRLETVHTVEHPWSWIGRMQYLRICAAAINKRQPDILLLPNYNMLPLLELLNYSPRCIVHFALEDLEQFGDSFVGRQIVRKIKRLSARIDVWVFPESNRAINDCRILEIPYDRVCIFYNVTPVDEFTLPTAYTHTGRVIYAGSVDFNRTVAQYFASPEVITMPIDVFGGLAGDPGQITAFQTAVQSQGVAIRYKGEVPARILQELLPTYAYSIVHWLPINSALLNAAPNKLFQAIAAGVPVITAPHPQCKMLVERYGCGIVLKDWTFNTFADGMRRALKKIGSPNFNAMVDGCKRAQQMELNWETQFCKLTSLLNVKLHARYIGNSSA